MKKHIYTILVCICIIIADSHTAFSQAGTLDNTFGFGGIVTTAIGSADDYGNSIVIQTDGKIVVAGYSTGSNDNFTLARYNSDGSLDITFDTDGVVFTDFSGNDADAYSVAIQSDGKILVGGAVYNSAPYCDFALVRYNTNGSLDNTFDSDGIVTTAIGSTYDFANSIAIQVDGKIVLGGSSFISGPNYDFAIVRYNTDGSLDNSFDTDGKVTTAIDSGSLGHFVAIQADGKIVLAGTSYNGFDEDFALARYNSDGSMDTTFDFDGKLTTDYGGSNDRGNSAALQSNGTILVAGSKDNGGPNIDFALVRYNSNGSLDNTFSTDGKLFTDFGSSADYGYSLVIQPDGKIIVAGTSNGISSYDFALARYNSDGSLDNSFDTDGKVTTDIGLNADQAYSVAIQSDGKIVVGGSSNNGTNNDFAIARYNNDLIGIEENNFAIIKVYPNPANKQISLSFDKELINASFKLINVSGQIILQKENLSGNNFTFDISEQVNGIYFVQVKNENEFFTQKIIKQ